MNKKTKLYQCPGYLFCMYELLELSTLKIAKECGVSFTTINSWLKEFNIRMNQCYSKPGENSPSWKGDDIKSYGGIHERAHQIDPKPIDGKCEICDKVADENGKTKLVHSNKDHSYRLPINPEEWWWIHESCHKKYDGSKECIPERKKGQIYCNFCNKPINKRRVILNNVAQNPNRLYFCRKECKLKFIFKLQDNF
ncbi:hypothetical protein LCGC14_2340350 [marine sediment metagenome]|uniref:Uncharacterized protein n=1 Tax=marine sediment metagenome TaxID=412755 RepID=A0A0F9F7A2_9ZZZZ